VSAPGDGIRCPRCGGETGVIETRANRGSLRRRRRCRTDGCRARLTTIEMVAPHYSKLVPSGDLVAMPAATADHLEVVPRSLMNALRQLLQAGGVGSTAPEEHW
jgi:hypothetical protein